MNTNLLSEPAFPDIIETRRRVADGTKSRDWLECVMEILSCTELLNEYWCLSKIPSAIVLGRWLLHPLLQQGMFLSLSLSLSFFLSLTHFQ